MTLKNFAFQHKQNGSIIIFNDGKTHTISKTALNYDVVLDAIKKGEYETALKLVTVADAVADMSDGRVKLFGEEIYLDGVPIHNALTSRIVALFKDGFVVTPLIRFLENVNANPSEVSRQELFIFLEHNDLPITPDGHFLAYKVVNDRYYDCHSNSVDNSIGQKPRLERGDVDPVRDNLCSFGLHFCSYEYVQHFRGKHLMVVKINPADVVSIPSDYNNAKGRCTGYEVVDEIEGFAEAIKPGYTSQYSESDDVHDYEGDSNDFDDSSVDDSDPVFTSTMVAGGKLSEHDVREIRRLLADGSWTLTGIAKAFDISARQVARIRDGEAWASVV